MPTPLVIIVLLQAAGAVLFGLGLRAYGTRRRGPGHSGLWIAPVLWVMAGILTAPASAAWLLGRFSAMNVVSVIAFLAGFAIVVTVAIRNHPTSRLDSTPGDELS